MRYFCWMPVLTAAIVGCQSEPPVELLTESFTAPPTVKSEIEVPTVRPPEIDWKVLETPPEPRTFDPLSKEGTSLRQPPRGVNLRQPGSGPHREQAVASALQWLATKQAKDGGWSFDGTVSRPRPHDRVTATSLVALAFLGAGQAPDVGKYHQTIRRAFEFLERETRAADPPHGPTWERSFAHVLPALAFCELQAKSREKKPSPAIQRLCDLTFADVRGDVESEPTLAALRILALREAYVIRCNYNSADSDEIFRATAPGEPSPATLSPATGLHQLLARSADPATDPTIQGLIRRGSTGRDIADDFLACTLFACSTDARTVSSYGQPIWKRLVDSQDQPPSPHAGSWYFADDVGGRTGGRIYCTALATLTIETYYRHLQLFTRFHRQTVRHGDQDFPQ